VGVSSCLLGQEVRYDATHCYDSYLVETLSRLVELVPVCPEMEVGMGTPRETVRLVGSADHPLMISSESHSDWTERMNAWAKTRVAQLSAENLSGFIFKNRSPSCGLDLVKLYPQSGPPILSGRGLFAAEFVRQFPATPVIESELLADEATREIFLERVRSWHHNM